MKNLRSITASLATITIITFGLVLLTATKSFAAPEPPVMSVNTSGTSVTISWSTVENSSGYRLHYAPYPFVGEETIGNIDMLEETEAFFLLWEGAAYYVAVTAYDDSGESEYSNIELFIMGPPTPEWVDDDGDGFTEVDGDCDDINASINPAATEVCGDGIDQDCDNEDTQCVTLSGIDLRGRWNYTSHFQPCPNQTEEGTLAWSYSGGQYSLTVNVTQVVPMTVVNGQIECQTVSVDYTCTDTGYTSSIEISETIFTAGMNSFDCSNAHHDTTEYLSTSEIVTSGTMPSDLGTIEFTTTITR